MNYNNVFASPKQTISTHRANETRGHKNNSMSSLTLAPKCCTTSIMDTNADPIVIAQYSDRLSGALAVGLDWDTAVIAVNVPTELIPILEADEGLTQLRKRITATMEYELLLLHQTARKVAASKGQGRPIEWALEQIRPEKYGRSSNNSPQNPVIVHDDL